MKFFINLLVENKPFGNRLPINYQYELSSFIYRTLAEADNHYAEWLHQNGFIADTKRFKLFSFSNLLFPSYKIVDDRIEIHSSKAGLIVSFLPERSTEEFVKGLFTEQCFCIGDIKSKVQFRISGIELLPSPDFASLQEYCTTSPVCITRKETDSKRIIYESPDSHYGQEALLINLKNKYFAFYGKELEGDARFRLRLTSHPLSKLISIKTNTLQQTLVRGYHFSFELQAIPELMHLAYFCGLGEKNAIGFGAIETRPSFKSMYERLKR